MNNNNFYNGKRVLIAGGAGLAGSALVRKLVPLGAEVTATEWKKRRIDERFRKALKIYSGFNLGTADEEALSELYENQDIVFWCGAMVGGAKFISGADNVANMIHTNLEMSMRNVLAAVKSKVKRFAYISSSYVYPETDNPATEDLTEYTDVPLRHYGLGWIKRYMETVCRHHHMNSDTKFALVRPTAYYGPNDDFDLETCHALPAFIRRFSEGGTIELWGDGTERRQYTYVDDLAEGLLRMVENYCVCDPVNIATAEVHTVGETATKVAILAEGVPTSWYFSGEGPTAVADRLVDVSKARRLLGFECKTGLDVGLKATFNWYREQYGKG